MERAILGTGKELDSFPAAAPSLASWFACHVLYFGRPSSARIMLGQSKPRIGEHVELFALPLANLASSPKEISTKILLPLSLSSIRKH